MVIYLVLLEIGGLIIRVNNTDNCEVVRLGLKRIEEGCEVIEDIFEKKISEARYIYINIFLICSNFRYDGYNYLKLLK